MQFCWLHNTIQNGPRDLEILQEKTYFLEGQLTQQNCADKFVLGTLHEKWSFLILAILWKWSYIIILLINAYYCDKVLSLFPKPGQDICSSLA